MDKKSRGSSQRGRPAVKKRRSTTEEIGLEEVKSRLARRTKVTIRKPGDEVTDFSEIPELTDFQLRSMKRVGPGRPPFGDAPRKMISIKLDQHLLSDLKQEALRSGKPYQSLIHEILQKHFKRKVA
ncbi:BrnA antitoxin family protein [Bdellovibrionota bacterium FG-2]